MDCACEIDAYCGGDGESCVFFTEVNIIARQELICDECYGKILVGETHEYIVGMWGNDVLANTTCIDCLSVRREFFNSYIFGALWEDFEYFIEENEGNVSEQCLSLNSTGLTPKAQEMVLDKIEDYWSFL